MSNSEQRSYADLTRGDPFPWEPLRDSKKTKFAFHTAAGRYFVFCFYPSATSPEAAAALAALQRHRSEFDDERACFFGISLDATDQESGRVRDDLPGIRYLFDSDGDISRLCGALPRTREEAADAAKPCWLVVDPTLRVLARAPLVADPTECDKIFQALHALPMPGQYAGFEFPIPVLVVPNVFDKSLCRQLVALYDQHGGTESGIFREGGGAHDHSFKRRKDYTIEDEALIRSLQGKIMNRVLPDIERLFFMKITRMERYIIGCYAAEDNAHFRPHRDNGPGLTAHRRFAVSINLTDDFDGGEVSFPEYSPRGIKAPRGWAVVFPAAILHAVSRVTAGRRYAFLPFVYDEGGAKIRNRELELYHAEQAAKAGVVAA